MWKVAAACILAALVARPTSAQEATPSMLAIDSDVSVDVTVDENGNHVQGVFMDSLASVEIGRGIQALVFMGALEIGEAAVRVPVGVAAVATHPAYSPGAVYQDE